MRPNEKLYCFSLLPITRQPPLRIRPPTTLAQSFTSDRVRGRRDRFTPVRIRVQHGKDRPTRRIVCNIVRQRISPQSDHKRQQPSEWQSRRSDDRALPGWKSAGHRDQCRGLLFGEPPRCGRLARRNSIGPSTCSRKKDSIPSASKSSPLPSLTTA